MNTGYSAPRTELTATELRHIANRITAEERLAWLFAQGADACAQPQLRSFFAHQSERCGERLVDLSSLLSSYAGSVR
ncbi:hypothetical protein MO973_24230 [Paenibacillus sp. TRM 82003]|nr:hypothetical protein [Paenibacillus sp. TRM 82003]